MSRVKCPIGLFPNLGSIIVPNVYAINKSDPNEFSIVKNFLRKNFFLQFHNISLPCQYIFVEELELSIIVDV